MYNNNISGLFKHSRILQIRKLLKRNYSGKRAPIPVILHPSWLGQTKPGVALSPYLIKTEYQKIQYFDNYYREPRSQHYTQIYFLNSGAKNDNLIDDLRSLYTVNSSVQNPRINIGGDHSMSISTLAYTLNKYPNAKVLWFDAHPDINTYDSSETKNIHGMPLSILSELDKTYRKNFSFIKNHLSLNNLMYIGIRSIDDYEKEVIDKYNISYIPSKIVNNNPEQSVSIIKDFISDSPFHLSIDVDSLSSDIMPCTGTPVENGIYYAQLQYLINHITSMNNLINVDLVELNIVDSDTSGMEKECLDKTTMLFQNILKNMEKLY
tara:strand:+ start:390 stop:1355 length:966 start_codon:yes stop_codon:yes gene_type:complete